jgi:hypothetical protein
VKLKVVSYILGTGEGQQIGAAYLKLCIRKMMKGEKEALQPWGTAPSEIITGKKQKQPLHHSLRDTTLQDESITLLLSCVNQWSMNS